MQSVNITRSNVWVIQNAASKREKTEYSKSWGINKVKNNN